MSNNSGAGALYDKIGFDKRGAASDGHGGTVSAFTEQFTCRGLIMHQRGGETVMAGRLEGRHTVIFRVRRSTNTALITPDWRATDKRSGTVYAIRDVTPTADRAYFDILAESGVAP